MTSLLVRHVESDSPPSGNRPRVTISGTRYNTMNQQKLTGILDRHYGGKRLGDMTMEEVEQALRDVRNEIKRLEHDALDAAKEMLQARGIQDDDREQIISDLFISRGVEDAAADVFFLGKIVEEFSKTSI